MGIENDYILALSLIEINNLTHGGVMAKKKYYTIMVTSDLSSRMHQFVVLKSLIKAAAIISCCFIILFGFLLYSYLTSNNQSRLVGKLKEQITRQKIDLQTYANAVKDLEKQVSYMQRFDKKLRAIASLDTSESPPGSVGIGGPSPQDGAKDLDRSPGKLAVADKLKKDLTKLSKAVAQQEDSFRELEGFFRYQKALFSSTPSIWPSKGWFASPFGYRKSPATGKNEMHYGIDISGREGSPIIAAADGIVSYIGKDEGYGNLIEVDHGFSVMTRYAHNSSNDVRIGQKVRKGEVIAKMGNTGKSTGPHLHFEVLINGVQVNPNRYILEEETILADAKSGGKKNRKVN